MEYRNDLHEIFTRHGTDKSLHKYDIPYTLLFEPLRQLPIRLCEIGVFNGASLRAWEEYFPRATIHAVDNDPKKRRFNTNRTTVFVADQGNLHDLHQLAAIAGGGWDIVIDDGGHCMHQQQNSLQVLYPHVFHGGFYVIEDIETSWNPAYNPDGRQTTANLILAEVTTSLRNGLTHPPRGIMIWPDIAIFAKP